MSCKIFHPTSKGYLVFINLNVVILPVDGELVRYDGYELVIYAISKRVSVNDMIWRGGEDNRNDQSLKLNSMQPMTFPDLVLKLKVRP